MLILDSPSLVERNHLFHRMFVEGIDVEYQDDGGTKYNKAILIDFNSPGRNRDGDYSPPPQQIPACGTTNYFIMNHHIEKNKFLRLKEY